MLISYTELKKAFETTFDSHTLQKGRAYQRQGRVKRYRVLSPNQLEAEVQGSEETPYALTMTGYPHAESYAIEMECDCRVVYACKHSAAVLIQCLEDLAGQSTLRLDDKFGEKPLDITTQAWLEDVTVSPPKTPRYKPEERLVFILEGDAFFYAKSVLIRTHIGRNLQKTGQLGKTHAFYPSTDRKKSRLTEEDLQLYGWLAVAADENKGPGVFSLRGKPMVRLLEKIVATGRCYWKTVSSAPLRQGPAKGAQFTWEMDSHSQQTLRCNLEAQGCYLLPTRPLWYVNSQTGEIGPVYSAFSEAMAHKLLSAPVLSPLAAKKVHQRLEQSTQAVPLPATFTSIQEERVTPVACLHLFCAPLSDIQYGYYGYQEKSYALARLSFRYQDQDVAWQDSSVFLSKLANHTLFAIPRDKAMEAQYQDTLEKNALTPVIKQYPAYTWQPNPRELLHSFIITDADNRATLTQFTALVIPMLQKAGWQISFDATYPFQEAIEVDEWYSDLSETGDSDWFNVELGIMLQGQRVSLLAPLVQMIKTQDVTQWLRTLNGASEEKLTLDVKGKLLVVPAARFIPLLQVLCELYSAKTWDEQQGLRISRFRASLLIEMEKAFAASQLRWFGSTALLELGRQLDNFTGIQAAVIPKAFQATLRPYQPDGVNWLQFLRDYRLNGILADEMGLGKTVQTLAHVLIEKEAGRLTSPCLIVAPTSVIANWRIEAARFTPSLRVLFLHGLQRKLYFTEIEQQDIVLTTYPLLVRDSEILLKPRFHVIILDEAQYIKNKQAKMTQIVHQLRSTHRICLTGTPLENHLGELWSLYPYSHAGFIGWQQRI